VARFYLKLDNVVLREYPVSDAPVTIGRLPDNTIHVDNLSVSGHHARIVLENGQWVLYDEGSTNGTYVNGQKVSRAVLANGDTVNIARHVISFADEPVSEVPAAAVPRAAPPAAVAAPVTPAKPVGRITVLSGKTDMQEYALTGMENVIGKSESAAIHLTRWFAPKVAATIRQRNGKYFITESPTPTGVRVNSEIVHGERELVSGDTILVDEVTLSFTLQG
jgi:pSer/pThr/pTyr-binding forkhead associated (FHA) protein